MFKSFHIADKSMFKNQYLYFWLVLIKHSNVANHQNKDLSNWRLKIDIWIDNEPK